jgi:hypothetical protein
VNARIQGKRGSGTLGHKDKLTSDWFSAKLRPSQEALM